MNITHYDLFAGIGGFSLALEEVFTDATIKHVFCEWESFPTSVLRQHWPDGEFWGDIVELVAYTDSQYTGLERRQQTEGPGHDGQPDRARQDEERQSFTIVTGGFPCQPFSAAGRRKGTADDRYQWPNMFAVIRNVKPEWVVAENVCGLVTWNEGMVLETVCADLESEGYEVQPFIIPAVAVGAPHRRDRVWVIASRKDSYGRRNVSELEDTDERLQRPQKQHEEESGQSAYSDRLWPDWSRRWQEVAFATCDDQLDDEVPDWLDGIIRGNGGLNGTESETISRQDLRDLYAAFQSENFRVAFGRCYKVRRTEVLLEVLRQLSEDTETTERNFQLTGPSVTEDYVRVVWEQSKARRTSQEWECYRESAGEHSDTMPELSRPSTLELAKAWYSLRLVQQSLKPEAVDNGEIKLSASQARQQQLKAYGNGIVPEVAMQIMKAIKETHDLQFDTS